MVESVELEDALLFEDVGWSSRNRIQDITIDADVVVNESRDYLVLLATQ